MATIIINSVDDVLADGAPANAFSDAVRNLPEVASKDFQDALRSFVKVQSDSVALHVEAAIAAKEAIETGDDAKKAEALAKIEVAETPVKDRERAELEKQRDDILARLAALDERAVSALTN